MLHRILRFNKKDWKHCLWLFRNMIKQFCLLNFDEADEAWYWLKIHLSYDSHRKS